MTQSIMAADGGKTAERGVIISDSGCDLTEEMRRDLDITLVPLTLRLGEEEFIDDEQFSRDDFMRRMKISKEKTGSAAPSPYLYLKAMEKNIRSFVVTLSGQLSASYANAVLAKGMLEEGNTACVLDSKSASAGQTLLTLKLFELIKSGLSAEAVAEAAGRFIDSLKTYFVLENYDNLQKNGRMAKLTERLIRTLHIKLVMGSDGNGNIAFYAACRGVKKMIDKLLQLIENGIESSGKKISEENLVISHCNNETLAEELKKAVASRFGFKKIYVVPTGGLSSLYADDRGIIMAF